MMFFSRLAWSPEMIIVGRLLVGFNCGLYTGLSPLYLSEIATTNIRGALGVLHQLFIVSGILLSQILGFPEIFGNSQHWDLLLGLTVVPCLIQLLVMPWNPESPRYLLITKQQTDAARKALQRLRATDDVEEDMKEMTREAQKNAEEPKISIWQLFTIKSLRMPLIISIVMQLSQQLSGINAIFYYSANLFQAAGLEESVAMHATSGVGAIMVAMTLVTLPLMDRVGRRTLHLIGLGGMFIFSILITVCLTLKDVVTWMNMASIVVSLMYVVFFAVGPGSIPWLIIAELFSQGPRPAALSISVLVNWVANFCVGYAFPHMQKGLENYSFVPFTILLALFWIFTFVFLPETKNKTFDEISTIWRKHREPDTNRNKEPYLVSYSTEHS
ncbi:glucose transporter type 1-like [Gigantopelta aegis]|uniref:glucose transporter type 1-like n=1 Tax=Gigantopelta aegis TaxID=1735272 RepID=UPI001B88B418|nr:glucose transporter type 1-like [Gigantopelta aegis]